MYVSTNFAIYVCAFIGAIILYKGFNKFWLCSACLGGERRYLQPLFLTARLCTVLIVNMYSMSRACFIGVSEHM